MLFNAMGRVITAIEAQKRNSARVNIHLDGVYAFSLARIVAAWLSVGRELSDAEIDSLKNEDVLEEASRIAMHYVGYKPRTIAELRKRLNEAKLPEAAIEHIISRFTENGLINDVKYARDWVDNRQLFHPRSTLMIDYELRRKGVAKEDIEAALAKATDDDQIAYRLANQKMDRLMNLDFQAFRSKLGSYLARRGFSYDVITRIVNRLWSEKDAGIK